MVQLMLGGHVLRPHRVAVQPVDTAVALAPSDPPAERKGHAQTPILAAVSVSEAAAGSCGDGPDDG